MAINQTATPLYPHRSLHNGQVIREHLSNWHTVDPTISMVKNGANPASFTFETWNKSKRQWEPNENTQANFDKRVSEIVVGPRSRLRGNHASLTKLIELSKACKSLAASGDLENEHKALLAQAMGQVILDLDIDTTELDNMLNG